MISLRSTKPTPHKWNTSANCLVFIDNLLLINHYKFEIGFYTINENPVLNDMALDQLEIFFNILMSNCIIVDKKDSDDEIMSNDLKNNKFMIPGKCNDQVIGCLIFLKLAKIVEENLEIAYVTISSELGKDISYSISEDSLELDVLIPTKEEWWKDSFVTFDPWWNRSDSATHDILINRDEIYRGDIDWQELFKEEIEEAEEFGSKSKKFKLINGGKNED